MAGLGRGLGFGLAVLTRVVALVTVWAGRPGVLRGAGLRAEQGRRAAGPAPLSRRVARIQAPSWRARPRPMRLRRLRAAVRVFRR
jgi:hypothetical protein